MSQTKTSNIIYIYLKRRQINEQQLQVLFLEPQVLFIKINSDINFDFGVIHLHLFQLKIVPF
jgi:hypothetical protein